MARATASLAGVRHLSSAAALHPQRQRISEANPRARGCACRLGARQRSSSGWRSFAVVGLWNHGRSGVLARVLCRARWAAEERPAALPKCGLPAAMAEGNSGHDVPLDSQDLPRRPADFTTPQERDWSSSSQSGRKFVPFTDTSSNLVKLALVASMLALCASPPWAWAGPEVARAKLNSTFDLGDLNDIQSGFASAFLLVFFSEIGDKTFFIAALLATRRSGLAVFSGTFGALATMTVISVFLGRVFHYLDGILPRFGDTKLPVDDIAACSLLIYFGVSTLVDAASMEDSESGDEQQEAELAIAGVGVSGPVAGTIAATFVLVFVAEWGDKSFFSTIALAAASSPLGVVTGAIAGHGAATLLAVLGGSFLGNYISEKVIAYIGGVLFLTFAGVTLIEILN